MGSQDIRDAIVAVVYAWPHLPLGIRERMRRGVESAVPEIESSHKGHCLVYDHQLLMVRPHEGDKKVVGVHEDLYVGTQVGEVSERELGVDVERNFRRIVDDYVDFDACLRHLS